MLRAWRALARQETSEDWRFVHLATVKRLSFEAGCYFPGSREALVVSFEGTKAFDRSRLPEGRGFDVVWIENQAVFADRTAIALVRSQEGSRDIFLLMAIDIIRSLESAVSVSSADLLDDFLLRVHEWQDFMSRKHRPLSPDAQIGLLGELHVLEMLLESRLGDHALRCWQGPLKAAQDFHIGAGVLEVKSTTSEKGFTARINSIEQLDSDRTPGFLTAIRFREAIDGVSLADAVARLRSRLAPSGSARMFDALLLVMGYMDEHAALYSRRFIQSEMRGFPLDDDMPRLTRSSVPAAVRSANYTIDLDAIRTPSVTCDQIFESFGLK
ncbi:PD-(D/E)XK motif protein [Rhizobium leguminosarum]|nr:PD-(D/E)XK motif protein [Rhizobium leguminosarum]